MIEFSAYQEVFGKLLTPGTECELPVYRISRGRSDWRYECLGLLAYRW